MGGEFLGWIWGRGLAWPLVFGREVIVRISELSLSLFRMCLACQAGIVSGVRLGELRVHHSQGQGVLRAAPLSQPWGESSAAVPSLASFSGAQNAGFRNAAEGGERPLPPRSCAASERRMCVPVCGAVWGWGTFPGVCPALSQTVPKSRHY